MRNATFLDWFLEVLLVGCFSGAVSLAVYWQGEWKPETIWYVAGGWCGMGLLRYIWRSVKAKNVGE